MNFLKNNSKLVIVFSLAIAFVLFLNIIMRMHPILNLFLYLADKEYLWVVPILIGIIFGIWQYNNNVKRKISNERVEIFNATIRTIQDVLQNSASTMQLLILDMKDTGVHDDIVQVAEKNIEELKKAISSLASVDPMSIQLKELNKRVSVIRIDK